MGGEFMDRAPEVKKHGSQAAGAGISWEMGSDPIPAVI
jgi:hypothetical protein